MIPWFGLSIVTRRRTRCLRGPSHPLAGQRPAEAVPDDVDPLRARCSEHGLDEGAQVGHVRDGRVRLRGADRRVGEDVALRAASRVPQLGGRVAAREQRVRGPARRRRTGCTRSGTACRCCRGAGSPASARAGPAAPKPSTGVPTDASAITGKSAGKVVPTAAEAGAGRRERRGEGGEQRPDHAKPPGSVRNRNTSSATQTGFSPPSHSTVAASVTCVPPGTSSTPRLRTVIARLPRRDGRGSGRC